MLSPEDHELFKAYYHSETKYFIDRLERYLDGKRSSFNIKAMFLQTFYHCYRKMYSWSVIFILAGFIIGVLQAVIFSGMSQSFKMGISQLINLAYVLIVAFYTNHLYIEKSIRDISKIKERTTNHEERLKLATKKGGVNWVAPFLLLVGLLFLWSWLANR